MYVADGLKHDNLVLRSSMIQHISVAWVCGALEPCPAPKKSSERSWMWRLVTGVDRHHFSSLISSFFKLNSNIFQRVTLFDLLHLSCVLSECLKMATNRKRGCIFVKKWSSMWRSMTRCYSTPHWAAYLLLFGIFHNLKVKQHWESKWLTVAMTQTQKE